MVQHSIEVEHIKSLGKYNVVSEILLAVRHDTCGIPPSETR